MNSIQVRKNVEFTRVNNDHYGNPRYAFHYLALADEYSEALQIAKQFGGKKFHNRAFGGGIVIQAYSLEESLKDIQKAVIDHNAGDYAIYLLECFDHADDQAISEKVEAIQAMYKAEFAYMGCTVEACRDYLQGLGGFGHAFYNQDIEKLGRGRFKAIRKNASAESVSDYVNGTYWDELAQGLLALLSIEFV